MSDLFDSSFDAFLFDMDGTILNSIAVAERVWGAWAVKVGLDPTVFLPTIHGRRAAETIAALGLTGLDPEVEAAAITRAEIEDIAGIVPIMGAAEFLQALPPGRWAVVTSAPAALARKRLAAAGLPVPAVLVSAEDVQNGKPAPDCFLLAAERLSVDPARCLVFEDADVGIRAATDAGCRVMVITESHRDGPQDSDGRIANYRRVRTNIVNEGLCLSRL